MAEENSLRRLLPVIAGAVAILVIIALIAYLVTRIELKPAKKEKKIQTVTLTPPPPPPPPPPKMEKPPEPEPEQKIEQKAEPEPEKLPDVPEQAPPRDLGLDAEGTAGTDGFGLAARKGGTGLFGGGGGNPFAWYGNLIKNDLTALLSEKDDLRKKGYTAIVKLWVEADGKVKRYELASGSNDPEIDQLLNKILGQYRKIDEAPPPGMQQPIKLKITSNL